MKQSQAVIVLAWVSYHFGILLLTVWALLDGSIGCGWRYDYLMPFYLNAFGVF
ncbi:hypothetical protein QU487_18385 [Crenobacter sp. SG2305]|uniref:hypothetical protein n=1 Tax=Crenobacter oryzisoli TaxID=3056844 RepID=UPI0025AB2412|nr:hypothetical protein [Crenobacter sp. SG2305]MDN0084703.1 hypothetical protein [Crenobacter sp. SG2305]